MTGRSRKTVVLCVLAWTFAATAGIQAYSHFVPYSLSWNHSASIPQGLYWTKAVSKPPLQHGELACFRYEAPQWAAQRHYFPEGFRLCKPVAGVPGDVVVRAKGFVRIESAGRTPLEVETAAVDSKGRPLSTAALPAGPVPQGSFVLIAPRYPNSLDSRYLGLIPSSKVTHQVWPLWVFE